MGAEMSGGFTSSGGPCCGGETCVGLRRGAGEGTKSSVTVVGEVLGEVVGCDGVTAVAVADGVGAVAAVSERAWIDAAGTGAGAGVRLGVRVRVCGVTGGGFTMLARSDVIASIQVSHFPR
jgi:hypothetical protein